MTPELRRWHQDFGQMSGFPPCCIAWYLDVWLPWSTDPAYPPQHTVFLENRRPRLPRFLGTVQVTNSSMPNPHWGYIPCPSCRATGAKVEVKRCGPPRPIPDPEIAEMWPEDMWPEEALR